MKWRERETDAKHFKGEVGPIGISLQVHCERDRGPDGERQRHQDPVADSDINISEEMNKSGLWKSVDQGQNNGGVQNNG